jgi:hypothetical protein
VPGLFPLHIDASGCKYQAYVQEPFKQVVVVEAPAVEQESDARPTPFDKRQVGDTHPHPEASHLEDTGRAEMGNAMRETLSDLNSVPAGQVQSASTEQVQGVAQARANCDPQGLIPSICSSPLEVF